MEKEPVTEIPEIQETVTEVPKKKKRQFTWTEKRREAWEKAKAARAHNIEVRKEAKKTPAPTPKRIVRRYVEVEESESEEEEVVIKKVPRRAPEPESELSSEEESVMTEQTPQPRPSRPQLRYV